ncbi:hypothetical protein [Gordonia otitidis]|uniref:Uncharacterized protein n=1 Tax=Gordonia otitidis (strain DSM 44809 / CCUG 52243 / JCM 12355 / NBRC 100426 / IFM 10032) TaxID=1108044 RepID=H5TP79_GORO1|nr:hypothetical protein [Gordonia otitidis]GAB35287.1 hypothetical protein GOOTI_152_00360 [Gordonia otitidis NBRC 100426]
MTIADQIDALARAATESIVGASREFSATQTDLASACAEHRSRPGSPSTLAREQLVIDADEADALPRVLLPADMAEASPHSPAEST